MRLAVFTDDVFRRSGRTVCADLSFPVFLAGMHSRLDRLVMIGRLEPGAGPCRHPLPSGVELVGLEPYSHLTGPLAVAGLAARSLPRLWRALDEVETVLLMGPHPLAMVFALVVLARRRRLVLGVRQDYPRYITARHPGHPAIAWTAKALEGAFRMLARFTPVVAVGPALARRYRKGRRTLDIRVSLIDEEAIRQVDRDYSGELRLLSVGRLDRDKNPLLLVDVLARLASDDDRWRLTVCGEGELAAELAAKLAEQGLSDRVELTGFVPIDSGLAEHYRESHFLLHVASTEGVPQVLYEAFATGLPAVATDVGGVREAASDAVMFIPPNDSGAAVRALRALSEDATLRRAYSQAALDQARSHSRQAELRRLLAFLDA